MPTTDKDKRNRWNRERRARKKAAGYGFEKEKANNRRKAVNRRARVLELFGGKCQVCGFGDHRALELDHVYRLEGGTRAFLGVTRRDMAILSGRVSITDFQLLCANCHKIKTVANKDNRPHVMGKRERKRGIQQRVRVQVWLSCEYCHVAFLVKAGVHEKRRFCGHKCNCAFNTFVKQGWKNSFIPGVQTVRKEWAPPLFAGIEKGGFG